MLVRNIFRSFVFSHLKTVHPFTGMAAPYIRTAFRLNQGMRALHTFAHASTEQKKFSDLFRFIQKNRPIPEFLSSLNPSDPRIAQLKEAIKTGNDQADIFKDPDCHLLLLHLMEKQHIPFEHGLTSYVYLMSLMQSTEKQALKPEDDAVKGKIPVKVRKLAERGALTAFGENYLKQLCHQFYQIEHPLNEDILSKYVTSLPPVEQWVLQMRYEATHLDLSDKSQHDDSIVDILLKNIPFILSEKIPHYPQKYNYWIPSTLLMHHLVKQISPHPLSTMPIFGRVGDATLLELHKQHIHPLPLYSPFVKSNLRRIHGASVAPVTAYIHDCGHGFWGSMLSLKERCQIFEDIIPMLQQLQQDALAKGDSPLVEKLADVIEKANDYNLTDIRDYLKKDSRFATYLKSLFFIEGYRDYYPDHARDHDRMDVLVEDRLLFMLNRMLYTKEMSARCRKNWEFIVTELNQHCRESHRGKAMVIAIIEEAEIDIHTSEAELTRLQKLASR